MEAFFPLQLNTSRLPEPDAVGMRSKYFSSGSILNGATPIDTLIHEDAEMIYP